MSVFLAECFGRFPKLSEVALIHKHCTAVEGGKEICWLPHRYATIYEEKKIDFNKGPFTVWQGFKFFADYQMEQTMALDRFIKALLTAVKSPTRLDIPTETLRTDHFQVHTSRPALLQILEGVKEFTLRCRDPPMSRYGPSGNSETLYHLSTENMPCLRHLNLDLGIAPVISGGNHAPKSFSFPPITHLTMRSGQIRGIRPYNSLGAIVNANPSLTYLAQRCQTSLKQVTMVNLVEGDWPDFLEPCLVIGLERLNIELEDGLVDAFDFQTCSIPDRKQLFGAAKTVVLSNEYTMLFNEEWKRMENQENDTFWENEAVRDPQICTALEPAGHRVHCHCCRSFRRTCIINIS
jgi:hypothetical protein